MNHDGYYEQIALEIETVNSVLQTNVIVYDGGADAGGNLTWTPRTIDTFAGRGIGAIVGDVNDDGYEDILTGGVQGANGLRIYLSDGDGGFHKMHVLPDQAFSNLNGISLGDVNGDGLTDIVSSLGGGGGFGVLLASTVCEGVTYGTGADDLLRGSGAVDCMFGRDGNDAIDGRGNDDKLYGELGNDFLNGNSGNDMLDGGGGNDKLKGGQWRRPDEGRQRQRHAHRRQGRRPDAGGLG